MLDKLTVRHNVTRREVEQCFENREGGLLEDTREQHRTNPPTQWFLACTNSGRLLKVIFVFENGKYMLKSAYEPNDTEKYIYERHGL
ncbi:ADP-ribosyl-(dinitrogen reductase) hydrolase [Malikia sp.]|uniref:ADP-ribosyl-(dinitrogen reductase) hydrolase n=1 Tax=Malikia sp. TaxID=2070706 RepID=UPI00261BAFEF|nr:ADP-ribosyl-(dinitrogen reductase) hydrolase [Malikia sp.]